MTRWLAGLFLLLCCSCIQLDGPPAERNYYRLQSTTSELEADASFTAPISIQVIDFPAYLERMQIVTHNGGQRIHIAPSAYWAEPLRDSLQSTLRRNLKKRLPAARISLYPWEVKQPEALKVELLINDFTATPGQTTWIDITWSVKKDRAVIAQGTLIKKDGIGPDFNDLVVALSRSLDDLSLVITDKLKAEL